MTATTLPIASPVRPMSLLEPEDPEVQSVAEAFGLVLRRHRRAVGLTQEELAERAGVSPRSLSGLERGEGAIPRRDTVALLAQALGLGGPERNAFEQLPVRARVRRSSKPATASDTVLDSVRHNVPRPLNSFVGREPELTELTSMIATAPLVTLVGAGGVGKTRLAVELARMHAARYAQGAWVVELAEVRDERLIASAIASALGVPTHHAASSVERLTEYLRTKHLLLVLDNCEHLVGGCAELLTTLLLACPALHILATSREPLAIQGEIIRLLQPLELPRARPRLPPEEVGRVPAVRMFVERAAAARASFALTEDNAAAVVRICVALDGIPLALELAAARMRLLTAEQLADRLERDTHVLRGMNRDGSPRHRTIGATIDWSYGLLGTEEQTLLRRLSVFAGGWTLQLAEDVCAGPGIERGAILNVLARLVDKSMVVVEVSQAAARYRLLEPIRQYAYELLDSSGEAADYAARHAAAVLRVVRPGQVDDFGPEEVASLDRFELEHANLRVALRWSLDHDQPEPALRAAASLFRFWERRGHFQEGCAWLEEGLARTATSGSVYRGVALNALAFLYWRVGDFERAQPIAEDALTCNRATGRTLAVAFSLGNLGAIAYFSGQFEVAAARLEESVKLGRQVGYEPFLAVVLAFLGRSLLRVAGPSDPRVIELLRESLALAESSRARYAIGQALLTLGDLHWQQGHTAGAVGCWRRALLARSDIADRRGVARVLQRLAWSLADSGQFESAAWLFGASESQQRWLGIRVRTDEYGQHADLVARTRARLGDGFAAPWSEGAASTLQQAVSMALHLTDTRNAEELVSYHRRSPVDARQRWPPLPASRHA